MRDNFNVIHPFVDDADDSKVMPKKKKGKQKNEDDQIVVRQIVQGDLIDPYVQNTNHFEHVNTEGFER